MGSCKITADGDCDHEIKRRLVLGRKVMTNLDSIFKSRDITLLTKVHLIKAMVFPVVIYGCERWTVKKVEKVQAVTDFIFLGSKISADGDCSHEIRRCLLLGRKVMPNLDNILESRDTTSPTKVCLVKAMVSSEVMYGCESWTVEKIEHRRIDAFKLWCWKRLLRVPWTARKSNQSILKRISPE